MINFPGIWNALTGATPDRKVRFHCLVQLILACVLVPTWGHAKSLCAPLDQIPLAEPRFESVGVGVIPRAVVPSLAQDKAGFLWIATGDGLVRFDGYRFRPQEHESQDPAARNLGWIRSLLSGRDGRLWIGTESDGLAVYDPASERVSLYRNDAGKHAGEAPGPKSAVPTIRALAEDRDGAIWMGSMGGGLDRFNPTSASFTHYRHSIQAGSLPDDRVQALLVDRQGALWIGTWAGLSRRKPGSNHFEPVFSEKSASPGTNLAGHNVQALFEASDGRIWVGTQQGDLAIIDPANAQGRMLAKATGAAAISQGPVSSFVEAPRGQLWVGRTSGIELYDVQNNCLQQQLRHDPLKSAGLAGNEVTTLVLDHAGWIWVGGFGLGLQRYNPDNRSIWMRGADPPPASVFKEANVHSLLQLDNADIWAATHDGDVAVMDRQLRVTGAVRLQPPGQGTAVSQPGRAGSTPPPGVDAMVQGRDGTVWLGAGSALYQFSRERRQLQVLRHNAGLTRRLLADSAGSLWVGTQDGLYRLRPGSTSLVRVTQHGDSQPLAGEVNAIVEGTDGSLWVGSVNGLFRIAPNENELQAVTAQADAGLANSGVIGLLFDRQQTLWVDTSVAGLHRMSHWDGQRARFDRISARHGIVSRPFGANLLEDGRGRIWTQMYIYDPAGDRLDELTAADGADLGTGWFYSYAKTADGRLLFGGSKGLLVVNPESFNASTYPPPLRASELRINGERQLAGQITGGLQLAPEQRSFSLEFAALDYSDSTRIRYAYQLEGFDPDWIKTGADFRVASYSNLNPGNYVLRARATNRSGMWSPHELAISVRVLPTWWQHWWFHLAALSLLAAMIYALMQWRTRRLRLRQLALEHTVHERTAELETLAQALQRESAALKESSLTDSMTGLRNRRFLTQHIETDIAMAVRGHESHQQYGSTLPEDADLIFFMFDIDHFKLVNDQHGHAAGDAVIKQMRSRLLRVFRETDYLVRWGGEEFLVVARGTSRSHAPELAERARSVVANQPFELEDGTFLTKTCSIGFCCFPLSPQHARALDWSAVVNNADAALYAVKSAGRNGWLGALNARSETAEALRAWARRPLADWVGSGDLDVVCSPKHHAWATAEFQAATP